MKVEKQLQRLREIDFLNLYEYSSWYHLIRIVNHNYEYSTVIKHIKSIYISLEKYAVNTNKYILRLRESGVNDENMNKEWINKLNKVEIYLFKEKLNKELENKNPIIKRSKI